MATDHVESSDGAVNASAIPQLILAAIPALRAAWSEVKEEHADPEGVGGRLGYLDAAWVVRHLTDRILAGDTCGFDAAFALIEHLVGEGDAYVSELGVVGYLEGLQMVAVTSRGVDPETFRPWFGPLSQRCWDAINEFWEMGTPIPRIESVDHDRDARIRRGEFVTADRLTLVSRVGWLDLEEPVFLQAGDRYRADWDARTVVVERLGGSGHTHLAKPSGPGSLR